MAERRKGSASRGAKAGSAKRGGRSSSGQKGQAGAAQGGRAGAQARRSQGGSGQRLPGWAWLLIGAVLGGLLFFLVQALRGSASAPSPPAQEAEPSSAAEPERSRAASRQEAAEEERDYDFYELLMNSEVTVPEAQQQSRREERQPADGGEPADSGEPPDEQGPEQAAQRRLDFGGGQAYLLQAGSFRRQEAADRMRASLALAGLRAEIHTVELDNGERWHRVRVGPFTERERLEQARARMESRDIQPLLLRRKG
ncbi:SPOR domain-containing protein [Halorhodospira neutriphila]|uniref:SPOR domain-containing protein n=1 Tax=Halorhodospira neutriphila TaxID=168379 RepID=A0ABS1E3R3_9GAMM|nr:SPOR domain-containing protein [Halorhodospira neutriphila]MBK1725869.1 hypothetical protein [Halorhodospira neutriphila]